MSTENPLQTAATPLTSVLRQLAVDIAQAQAALDVEAEKQAIEAAERESPLPAIAFYFPEIELNLSIAFSITKIENTTTLTVAPANPTNSSFFQNTSFSSSLRALIAPRTLIVPAPPEEENL